MKTPKRISSKPKAVSILSHERSRWKRKNRIKQLKNTIAKQREEIEHFKTLLAIRVLEDYTEQQKESIEWAAKRLAIDTFGDTFSKENNVIVRHIYRPIIKWDNKEISVTYL